MEIHSCSNKSKMSKKNPVTSSSSQNFTPAEPRSFITFGVRMNDYSRLMSMNENNVNVTRRMWQMKVSRHTMNGKFWHKVSPSNRSDKSHGSSKPVEEEHRGYNIYIYIHNPRRRTLKIREFQWRNVTSSWFMWWSGEKSKGEETSWV